MKTFRQVIFWSHLVSGLLAGVAILIMCLTGTILAFEKEIVAWVDRAGAVVAVPADGAPRLTVEEMVHRAQATQPGARAASLIVKADPAAAVTMTLGTATVYVNPYTGAVTPQGAARTRAFMRTMTTWHRYLGFGTENRTTGKQLAGAGNLIFFVLAVTGLTIWMPRTWSWRALRPSLWFTGASGKARDWNWHNVIGVWTTPVLIVLTLTALPISYAWVSTRINRLNAPAPGASPSMSRNAVQTGQGPAGNAAAASAPAAPRQTFQALLTTAQAEVPDWKQITLRLDGGAGAQRGGGAAPAAGAAAGRGGRGGAGGATAAAANPPPAVAPRPAGNGPVSVTVREAHSWPRTANITLTLDPFTGQVLTRNGYAQMGTGQQIRAWTRFLHTGEALGPIGQFVAGVACLGGCFLVYTGFALSWRRFFGRRPKTPAASPAVREPALAEAARE